MQDLISRQAAIDAIEEMQMPIMRSIFPEEQFVFKGMSEALSAINELPSAQSEIIRCKDCKWYECSIMAADFGVCCHPDWVVDNCGFAVYENGWCYRAERRTDATDEHRHAR